MRRFLGAALACAAVGSTSLAFESQQNDATSCNIYKTALSEIRRGDLTGAIQSLDRVIGGCQDVDTKAQAWLQVGRIRLSQWPPDVVAAKSAAETITRAPYLNTPFSADGFILKGLAELADGRNFAAALTEFQKVDQNLTRSTDALAEAQYQIGELQRLNHEPDLALRTFQQIPLKYPRTEWAARALISAASCQTRLGQYRQAMESLQRVRRDRPGSEEAEFALQRNTILHRLFLKGREQELLPVVTAKKGYRDGVSLTMNRQGQVLVAHRGGLAILKPDTGEELRSVALSSSPLFDVTSVGMWGDVAALGRERVIVRDKAGLAAFQPVSPKSDGVEDVEVTAFVANWRGEWLVADGKTATIRRYHPDGKPQSALFAERMKASRLAQNDVDDIAVLDPGEKVVYLLDRNAGGQRPIPKKQAPDYDFDSPVDVAFDVLGNIYVLDSGRNNIVVFDPALRFKTTLTFPLKTVRKPIALAVDRAGRIYVLEKDGQPVIGYQ